MERERSDAGRVRHVEPSELTPLERQLELTCTACGKTDSYAVGTVFIDPDRLDEHPDSLEAAMAFSGYFRCRACDAGGPWRFPASTAVHLMTRLIRMKSWREGSPLVFGNLLLFDGTKIRYATEGEEHIKRLIALQPGNAFLWGRLGNFYRKCGRKAKAKEAYKEALELDESELESRHSLAEILKAEGELSESAKNLHCILKNAWKKKGMERGLLRNIVRHALESLFHVHEESGGKIEVFPPGQPEELPPSANEELVLEIREFDLSTESGWEDILSMFLREPRRSSRNLPRWMRRTFAASAVAPARPARNHACPCGSGRKYKNCCGP